jgi:hypothetical protein
VKLVLLRASEASPQGNGHRFRLRFTYKTQRSTRFAIVAQNGKAIWTLMVRPEKLSKLESGDLWYVYPWQQPFKSAVLKVLARLER